MTAAGRRHDEPDDDLSELRAELAGNIGQIAETLRGEPPNKALSTRSTLCFGNKGALKIEVAGQKRGIWYDHSAGRGGGALELVLYLRGRGWGDALDLARAWVGIGPDQAARNRPRPTPIRLPASDAGHDAERVQKIEVTQRLWREAGPVEGTPGEQNLVGERGIPKPGGEWPKAVRYHERTQSLVFAATLSNGTVQAVQRVLLTPEGCNLRNEAGQKVKLSSGPQAGTAVRLAALPGQEDGPLLLAEGPETGLSLWRATGWETWITLGSMGKADPPAGRQVVACADDDPVAADTRRGNATRGLQDALRRWQAAGLDVVKATPFATPKGDGGDFNDLLRAEGLEAVEGRVELALAPPVASLQAARRMTLAEGRPALDKAVGTFFEIARAWQPPARDEEGPAPPVHMIRVDVAGGKSLAARKHTAALLMQLRAAGDMRGVAIAVPSLRLADEQAAAFNAMPDVLAYGLKARVWRGRAAADPERAGQTMCDDLDAVAMVQEAGGNALELACGTKNDGPHCPLFGACGYQRQIREAPPDVWIMAHELLFQKPSKAMGTIAAVVVDEGFYGSGLIKHGTFPLDLLDKPVVALAARLTVDRLGFLRRRLLEMLRELPDGPLPRSNLAAFFDPVNTGEAYRLEWHEEIPVEMYPGMSRQARREARDVAAGNRDMRRLAALWDAVKELVKPDGPERSGWVELDRDQDGCRVVHVRGLASIKTAWQVPTLVIDAILDPVLVWPFYPQAELVAEIALATPHQTVWQVTDKAYSKGMYIPVAEGPRAATTARNNLVKLRAILVCVARRYRPGRVLAVVQKAVEDGLRELGNLPGNLDLAHHNAVAGLDHWQDVRALVVVGRTLPGPGAMEQAAAQLTGRQPEAVEGWYMRVPTVREMADGQAVPTDAAYHPDPVVEAMRWQAAEGELVQIIGRGRGVNRTAANPLDVLVMTDMPLPLPVNRLVTAASLDPSPVDFMLAQGGVALVNPTDAAAAYPDLWGNREAAKKALARGKLGTDAYERVPIGECPQLLRVRYQVAGQGRSMAEAMVDVAMVPDPRAWLETRLGALASYTPTSAVLDIQTPHIPGHDLCPNPARAVRSDVEPPPNPDQEQNMAHFPVAAPKPPGQVGLDPGLILRGPVASAWQPPAFLLRSGERMIEMPSVPVPTPSPWLLLPTRPARTWYRDLDVATLAEAGVVWWGPLRPVLPVGMDGLAFRRRGGSPPVVVTQAKMIGRKRDGKTA